MGIVPLRNTAVCAYHKPTYILRRWSHVYRPHLVKVYQLPADWFVDNFSTASLAVLIEQRWMRR